MEKIRTVVELYSITVTETIDLVKDIIYCYIVNHTNQVLTILLWMHALFAFAYDVISILLLTRKQYQQIFGQKDLLELTKTKYK